MDQESYDRDRKVIETMINLGGGFVEALGRAAARADTENLARIKAAFPEIWDQYAKRYDRVAGSSPVTGTAEQIAEQIGDRMENDPDFRKMVEIKAGEMTEKKGVTL